MSELHTELDATVTATTSTGLVVQTGPATLRPARYPLTIVRGAQWTLYATWWNAPNQPVNVSTGYSAAFTIYDEPGGTALVSLASGGSGITLAATAPTITVSRTATETGLYTWGPQAWYVLTVTQTTGSIVRALLCGRLEVQ